MAVIVAKVYRFEPAEIPNGTLAASLAAALAADVVDSADVVSFDMEITRGEVVYTVLHV